MSGFIRKSGAVLFTLMGVLTSAANAEPNRHSTSSMTMSIGSPAAAPSGFLEFCRREPAQCQPAQPEIFDANAVARQATSLYWENVFAHRAGGPAPARTAAIISSSSRPSDRMGRDRKAASSRNRTAPLTNRGSASSFTDFVETSDARPFGTTEATPPNVIPLDRAHWALLNSVNRAVNRRIHQVSDERAFGKVDYWQAPTEDGAAGDCEDFVLAKREALIKAGIPATALSIAVVETRWGETHAVLLVAGDTGDYVMDNLSSWISRWDRVDYTWRQRQAPGKIFEWVNVAA